MAFQCFLHRLVGVVRARFAQIDGYVCDAAPSFLILAETPCTAR
ncbi:hypothetical protein HMPREF1141_1501 [Clostridium sp. MSTE9]|nr:hypothetical protein HMPREF1141_1501 [Clostridium sp. MSTE9]